MSASTVARATRPSALLPVRPRPGGGRPYIGPKAQSSVHEAFFDRAAIEATDRQIPMTDVWREIIYAGLLRTGRATRAEVREACAVVGIPFSVVTGEA